MPQKSVIDGFKGTIDFYLWKGIPCARRWPRHKPRAPYPGEADNQQAFAYSNKLWPTLSADVQQPYRNMAVGTPYTGKDIMVITFMRGIPFAPA